MSHPPNYDEFATIEISGNWVTVSFPRVMEGEKSSPGEQVTEQVTGKVAGEVAGEEIRQDIPEIGTKY
ncbi:MAG: hypothetical protein GY864_04635 [Desulfobacterales bacterium]|nr:hypothetical protein [Desulfobacterales bacterium]